MICFRLKRHVLNCFILVIMTDYVMFEKKTQKNDRIVNINKENMKLIAFMYIRVIISPVRKYSLCGFRKINRNILYTHNSYNMLKKKKNI